MFLSIGLVLIFSVLSLFHFYWVFGGTVGLDKAVPTKTKGEKAMNPGWFATATVGIGLGAFAFFYVLKGGFLELDLPSWVVDYFGWGISGIFFIRAMGEFNYVGFFKKVKDTEFAKWDTKLFSPLCLLISSFGFAIELMV